MYFGCVIHKMYFYTAAAKILPRFRPIPVVICSNQRKFRNFRKHPILIDFCANCGLLSGPNSSPKIDFSYISQALLS
jgi:hypothetical protein